MKFSPNTTQIYLNRIKTHCSDERVLSAATELINNLSNLEAIEKTAIEFREANRSDWTQLQQIITVAYNARYATQQDAQVVDFGEVGAGPNIKTVVAVTQGVILGTLRLVRGDLELFKFFELDSGWPYLAKNQVPYEFERLAFHPYYDLTQDDAGRIEILRGLVNELTSELNLAKSWLACTMSPNVKSFMDRAGMRVQEITQARLADNEVTRFQLQHWPSYFQNCRPYEVFLKDDDKILSHDERIWRELISEDWNFAVAREKLNNPRTQYPGRPVLLSAAEVADARVFDLSDSHLSVRLGGQTLDNVTGKFYSLIDSTYAKLQENLSVTSGPIYDYLTHEWQKWATLTDKLTYGFFAFYFARNGELEAVVQFPPLPAWKLALCSSPGQLLQNKNYTSTWLEARQIFARAHVLVAGASVASATAENLIRDGRIGYVTIGDPKGPNATNFNRTNYDVIDIGSEETKAVCFARRLHRQDPTQVIYLNQEGFNRSNITDWLTGQHGTKPVDVAVEAIDTLMDKLAIVELAGNLNIPVVQVSDVGSIAQLTFINAGARARGESLVFGLSDDKLQALLAKDFLQVAARMVGLENAIKDELGRYVSGKKNTPFGVAMPQLGSTANVAAGIASEKILRYLLESPNGDSFEYRRITIDKKNNQFRSYHTPSIKERALALVMAAKAAQKS